MFGIFRRLFGTVNDRVIKSYREEVLHINALEEKISKLNDNQLKNKTLEFKQKLANGASLDDITYEAFAVARESSKRVSRKRHFDEQLMGGLALHRG
ncbi:MAG: preprotein translocase subunit SecA, partial [Rickettsiaceae bacterium]|nr:preprotein translocase subunit SecA [Rickettsiaceae bacterium]